MSKLEFYARPLVAFDPSNKEHRKWYHEFMQYGGWGKCPVRFICPADIGYDLTRSLCELEQAHPVPSGKKSASGVMYCSLLVFAELFRHFSILKSA